MGTTLYKYNQVLGGATTVPISIAKQLLNVSYFLVYIVIFPYEICILTSFEHLVFLDTTGVFYLEKVSHPALLNICSLYRNLIVLLQAVKTARSLYYFN